MRILVDHSGYSLLNIGDIAMLRSCIIRLRQQWPDAETMVISDAPERLATYCPGAIPIDCGSHRVPFSRFMPHRYQLAALQAWKMAGPYSSGRVPSRQVRTAPPGTAIQAVIAADLVVASGGGYVTDTWWWHAVGVLSLLALAQRLGKPTAMFGQGIGPISQPILRRQARSVLPKLAALGLREEQIGLDLALSYGVPSRRVTVTGDDALELIEPACASGYALGLNMRVSSYAKVCQEEAAAVGDIVVQEARSFQAPIVALPVSRYSADSDLDAIRTLLQPEHHDVELVESDLRTPEALSGAVASCRAVVTGSYHAAVFGLAQGVPAVCLTKSSYYDAKFEGLRALFPGTCSIVPLAHPDFTDLLRSSLRHAWHLPRTSRAAARDSAIQQRDAGRRAYAQFRLAVEQTATSATTSQGTVT